MADAGELQLALHVVDLLALAPGDDPLIEEALQAKATWCDAIDEQTKQFVSRPLYNGSARLLRNGHVPIPVISYAQSQAPEGVHSLTAP